MRDDKLIFPPQFILKFRTSEYYCYFVFKKKLLAFEQESKVDLFK